MYDTIKLSGTLEDVGLRGTDFVKYFEHRYPDTFTPSENPNTKRRSLRLKLDNLQILALEGYIYIENSFCKYLHDNNLVDFQFTDTPIAFSKLEAFLGFPIGRLRVGRVDFGANLILSDSVSKYNELLVYHPDYSRRIHNDTLYFEIKRRTLSFYDKIACERELEIPIEFEGKNLMRYELRYLNKIKDQLGVILRAHHLIDADIFGFFLDVWKNEYYAIVKQKGLTIHLDSATSKADFMRLFFLSELSKAGVDLSTLEVKALAEIENLHKAKFFNSRSNPKARYVQKVLDDFSLGFKATDLQRELDEAIDETFNKFQP